MRVKKMKTPNLNPPRYNPVAHALHTQGQYKPHTIKPRKGKGSYSRKGRNRDLR